MKTINCYETEKQKILKNVLPYRIIRLGELGIVGPETFELDGVQLNFGQIATTKLDTILGFKKARIVKKEEEEVLLKSRRFALKEFKGLKDTEIALIVAPTNCTIVDIAPMKSETGISAGSFFDFVDILMEKGYVPTNIAVDRSPANGINITLDPKNKKVVSLSENEEFISNGIYLNWNLNQIEIGHYFTRLSCLNGTMRKEMKKEALINMMTDENTSKTLSMLKSRDYSKNAFDTYAIDCHNAIESVASLKELKNSYRVLKSSLPDEDRIEEITNYNKYLNIFTSQGIDIKRNMHLIKTDINVWDLYNNITYIASHNNFEDDDLRASKYLLGYADTLLRERDIKNYISID